MNNVGGPGPKANLTSNFIPDAKEPRTQAAPEAPAPAAAQRAWGAQALDTMKAWAGIGQGHKPKASDVNELSRVLTKAIPGNEQVALAKALKGTETRAQVDAAIAQHAPSIAGDPKLETFARLLHSGMQNGKP